MPSQELSYLKSMDSLMNELSEKGYLSRYKGLIDEQILNCFNIEDIAKERHNGGFGL